MRFLVTGAQGFLGEQVVRALRARGHSVTPVGRRVAEGVSLCDLTVAKDIVRLVDKVAPDRIVHCAAYGPKNSGEYNDSNSMQASLRMLDLVLASSVCPVVYISSMTVYGTEHKNPVVEGDAGDATSAYALGKWQGEKLLDADGRSCFAVRIPGLFGPVRHDGLVFNMVYAAKYGQMPRLPSTSLLWAAMHVDDAAESIATLALAENLPAGFEAVNIGYRGEYSISTLVSSVANIHGRQVDYAVKQPKFEFDLTRAERYSAVPVCDFREALLKFGEQI